MTGVPLPIMRLPRRKRSRPATDLIDHKRGRMTSEDRSLLRKAAADPKGQVAIKRARQTWRLDRERLDMLARCGHLLPLANGSASWGNVRPLADHGCRTSRRRAGWFGPS
jgi:hypothetical protein